MNSSQSSRSPTLASEPEDKVVRVVGDGTSYSQKVSVRSHSRYHSLVADEPIELGGNDLGPTPTELIAAGLASCTTITVTMYAKRKGWPLAGISVDVEQKKVDGKTQFSKVLHLEGELDDEQLGRLVEISKRCPVHKMISSGADITTELSSAEAKGR